MATLGNELSGVSAKDEARCDQWAARGQHLRAAVGWRCFQGKDEIMAAVVGVPVEALWKFVNTGKISAAHRALVEANQR